MTIRTLVVSALMVFELAVLSYFLVINTLYLLFSVVAFFKLRHHRRRWTARELGAVMRSPGTPAISIVVPAYNEEATAVESLRSLLFLNYPQFEVVVVNDGSTDRTLEAIVTEFDLVRAPISYSAALDSEPVHAVYRSLVNQDLVLIDKANGGKSDAINAGINAARHPLVCLIDADSLLEEHALTRAVLPFIEKPETIAVGGIVRIANGCKVDHGRVTEIGVPKNKLAIFQVIEYLRAFLAGRVTHSSLNGLLIISGAFGIFNRQAVIEAGGLRAGTVGEDMELVTRLHRIYRERGTPYRIVFQPDPVCWTEVPETRDSLARQRNRWQRGTLQVLGYHWPMMMNRRYGVVGVLILPYYLIFEGLGPIIEFSGYLLTALAIPLGLLHWRFAELLFLTAVVYGALISVAAVILEEISFRRYPRVTDLLRLSAYAVVENFGYRQVETWWRVSGVIDFVKRRQDWGAHTRKGFKTV
jgi:cellulose synthase/poly-beta-1,6-N-acetylglucosamine synthase-like glycosyltransferase